MSTAVRCKQHVQASARLINYVTELGAESFIKTVAAMTIDRVKDMVKNAESG